MEKFSVVIDGYVDYLLAELERTNSNDIIIELSTDLKFKLFFNLLMERLVFRALEQGKIINSFPILKAIPINQDKRLYPEFVQIGSIDNKHTKQSKDTSFGYVKKVRKNYTEVNKEYFEDVFPCLMLCRGTLMRILEAMKLYKSRAYLIKHVIVNDKELKEHNNFSYYYPEEELKEVINDTTGDGFQDILDAELKEKYASKKIVLDA